MKTAFFSRGTPRPRPPAWACRGRRATARRPPGPCSAYFRCISTTWGKFSLQGPHQVAQASTRVNLAFLFAAIRASISSILDRDELHAPAGRVPPRWRRSRWFECMAGRARSVFAREGPPRPTRRVQDERSSAVRGHGDRPSRVRVRSGQAGSRPSAVDIDGETGIGDPSAAGRWVGRRRRAGRGNAAGGMGRRRAEVMRSPSRGNCRDAGGLSSSRT